MKAIHQIKSWFKKLHAAFALEPVCLDQLFGEPKRCPLAVEFAPVVQFNPPLNFRRPALDSLKDSGAFSRIELRPPARRAGWRE